VLAAELAATPAHVTAALARYDAARRPRAQKMSRLSDRAGRPIELASPAAAAARNLLIRGLPRRAMIASLARPAKWTAPSISP
jgi:2-polyprenyl-6-methoxyphenol hydroxylase-like FAD-dependent oxidoreductase